MPIDASLQVATQSRRFGRAQSASADRKPGIGDDLRLFALTYAAGFLFMTMFLS
jgi:hypothetical protein